MEKVYFDAHNLEHLEAYESLCKVGVWPDNIHFKDVDENHGWKDIMLNKMAKAWREYKIELEKEYNKKLI